MLTSLGLGALELRGGGAEIVSAAEIGAVGGGSGGRWVVEALPPPVCCTAAARCEALRARARSEWYCWRYLCAWLRSPSTSECSAAAEWLYGLTGE